MAISRRISEMIEKSSWIRTMFETGSRMKAQYGPDQVCDFSLGNPNLAPPERFNRVLISLLKSDIPRMHSYMPNAGYPEVRETLARSISNEHGIELNSSHLIMTCGAGGGLNVALKTLLDPGDHILVSAPGFMEYFFYADNHGGTLHMVKSRDDFDLDVEKIESRITGDTAAVIVNSPNNPSGKIYPESTLRALGDMLTSKSRKIGRTVYLLSDEPYRKIVFDDIKVPSVFSCYRNSIIISSYSKDLSIPGERIGWMAVHPEAESVDEFLSGAILCNRILGYVNAPALMQRVVREIHDESIDVSVYKRKRDMLCAGLKRIGYDFRVPDGTFYLFPKAPGGDDLAVVSALQEQRILTVPGRGFGLQGYFRIAFCVEDEVIHRSFEGFSRAYSELTKN